MPITNTDAVIWYNVDTFGKAGYAIPNWSNDIGSLNPQILDWVDLVGRNLFNIMHHEDVDLRTPPSINTCKRIHKLYIRSVQKLLGSALAPGEDNMETFHVRPAGEVFRVYPIPFFKARNPYLRRWAGMILMSLAEAMQHTENRKEVEISVAFAAAVLQYIKRVYVNMAVELFGKARAEAMADGFMLTDEELAAYNPADFHTSTEMVDTVPRLDRVFTEDRLEVLAEGIPVTSLPADLGPWPSNLTEFYQGTRTDSTIGADSQANGSTQVSTADGGLPPVPPVNV